MFALTAILSRNVSVSGNLSRREGKAVTSRSQFLRDLDSGASDEEEVCYGERILKTLAQHTAKCLSDGRH